MKNLKSKKPVFEIIINIPIYDYTLHIIDLTNAELEKVQFYLDKEKLPQDISEEITEDIKLESYNGVYTIHSGYTSDIYVFMYPHDNIERYRATINHELFHVICKIQNRLNLDEEAGAYLCGYITNKFYEFNIL